MDNYLFICNFNDLTSLEGIPYVGLQQLWSQDWTLETLETSIKRLIEFEAIAEEDEQNAINLLCDCILLILVFIQYNFTGPIVDLKDCINMIKKNLSDFDTFSALSANGEEVNPNVKCGELLAIAKSKLKILIETYPQSKVLLWWQMRLICLQQNILDDLADELFQNFKNTADNLLDNIEINDNELEILLNLEVANGFLQFHRSDLSSRIIDKLCEQHNISLNVEGLLGKRTKFQQKSLPQLCLKVNQRNLHLPTANSTNGKIDLPSLLLLEDDTRLEKIEFDDVENNSVMTLPSVIQVLVLSKVMLLKRSQPKDRLADEELEPYIQTLLYQREGPLQARLSALLFQCIQESGMRRTVERSWKQCEECIKIVENSEKYTLRDRLSYGFASFLKPKWHIQMQLCGILRSLGLTKTALDIYLQIQSWEQVIECYNSLELRHKAAEVIRQELARKPTALLYCLLGDAEDNPKYYEDAWQFSKYTSGKAQAYWGNYYFRRYEYSSAIEHLEKSLEINKLQEKILLRYGYCAIQLERWETAVHAYISYTHLEPNGFESWNNLAKALINLGDKQRAFKVLGESLKCNYNNRKVWENFLFVSVDTGHLEDAIRAYNRIIEFKDNFIDIEVLSIIINGVAKTDANAKEYTQLRKKAVNLMGQQCIKHGNEPLMWELASLIAATPLKKAEKLVKSYRAYTSKNTNWTDKEESVIKLLKLSVDFCILSLNAIDEHSVDESEAMITSQLNSSRLSALSCISVLKRINNSDASSEQKELQMKLVSFLETIKEKLNKRMS